MSASPQPVLSPASKPLIDLAALRQATVHDVPFEYFVVPNFVPQGQLSAVNRDFPEITKGGSFPLDDLTYGTAFRQLTEELLSDELRNAIAEKFQMILTHRPATLTVRGQSRAKDGRIHTDSKTKLITVLLYLNESWPHAGGKLRLLKSGSDIEDHFGEVIPGEGNLLVFRCRENAWHGHKPFVGERRSMQLNYVTDEDAANRNGRIHRISSFVKRLNPF